MVASRLALFHNCQIPIKNYKEQRVTTRGNGVQMCTILKMQLINSNDVVNTLLNNTRVVHSFNAALFFSDHFVTSINNVQIFGVFSLFSLSLSKFWVLFERVFDLRQN